VPQGEMIPIFLSHKRYAAVIDANFYCICIYRTWLTRSCNHFHKPEISDAHIRYKEAVLLF